MPKLYLSKVVSGGQTGVDRAALEVAMFLNIPHGGWCPKGRRAEDGPIPSIFQLVETPSFNYAVRTEKNVVDSDGTLILFRNHITRGTGLTVKFARRHKRPHLCVDLASFDIEDEEATEESASKILEWLMVENINVLNVAGPRESTTPKINCQSHTLLLNTFADIQVPS